MFFWEREIKILIYSSNIKNTDKHIDNTVTFISAAFKYVCMSARSRQLQF